MNILVRYFLVILAGLLVVPSSAQAQGYDYQTVDYPGTATTFLNGINKKGDAVGAGYSFPDLFPFIYDAKKGTFTSIAPVANYDATVPTDIAGNGDVAGVVAEGPNVSGLILDKKGNVTVVEHPGAGGTTVFRGINMRGLVAGFYLNVSGSNIITGFIYDSTDGSFSDISLGADTQAEGINLRGDVVGYTAFFSGLGDTDPCGNADSAYYGWLRTTDGNITYVNVNGEVPRIGISDAGTIAGYISSGGFVTEIDSTQQCQYITIAEEDLLKFPGASFTAPSGINKDGVVSGYYYDEFGVQHGFIATPK